MLSLRGLYFLDDASTQTSSLIFRALSKVGITSSNILGNIGATVREESNRVSIMEEAEWDVEDMAEKPQYTWDPFGQGMMEGFDANSTEERITL